MDGYLEETERCLREDNLEEAEVLVNRASLLLNDVKDNIVLVIKYKVAYFIVTKKFLTVSKY